jgi:hypothetical protein
MCGFLSPFLAVLFAVPAVPQCFLPSALFASAVPNDMMDLSSSDGGVSETSDVRVGKLIRSLGSADEDARAEAKAALVKAAVGPLSAALKDENERVRRAAVEALRRIRNRD